MNIALILIPIVAIITAFAGNKITNTGMKWYTNIRKPNWTPSVKVIRSIWIVLFILSTTSAVITWQSTTGIDRFFILGLFATNAVLTILWSYIFFRKHQMGIAVFETGALCLSALTIILAVWSASYIAAILLLPYVLWVSFATLLTHKVWKLNTNWKWNSI